MSRTYGTNVGNLSITESLTENLERMIHAMPARAAEALNVVGEETMEEAKRRTPVLTGHLRRSGLVHHASARDLSVRLTFGTEYAVFVHERTELRHRVGEAKFLENALAFTARFFAARIGNELLGRSFGAGSPGGVGNL